MLALVGLIAPRPEQPDDLQGFTQPLMTAAHTWKALPHYVLVESLTRPDAEGEASIGNQGERRRGLGDDRRVVADGRAGDSGGQADRLGSGGDRAQDRPGER